MKRFEPTETVTALAAKPARHTRLFELIRQKNLAETTVARVNGLSIRKISAAEVEQLQAAASRSLQARPASHAAWI